MLKFSFIPTLKHLMLSSLSRELWKQLDIASEIKDLFHSHSGTSEFALVAMKWPEIRRKVFHKLNLLRLPFTLKEKAEDIVEITGRQILIWIQNYNKQFCPQVDMVNFLHLLQWNSLGGIDEKEIAALILETRDGLSLQHRYILACNNCLEESVRLLWNQIPVHQTMSVFSNMSNDIINGETNLVQYWSYYNEGVLDLLDNLLIRYNSTRTHRNSLIEFYVDWSCRNSKNVAFQYFWEKLTEEEKLPVHYAIMSATAEKYSVNDDRRDIFYFLVTNMNESQLKELVEHDPSTILNFWFREGVRQNRILFTYDDTLWNVRPSGDLCAIFSDVAEFASYQVLSKCFGERSQMLFQHMWKNTPSHIKRSFFGKRDLIWNLLSCFIFILDTVTLQIIYDDASVEEKKSIKGSLFHHFESQYFFAKQHWKREKTDHRKTVLSENEIDDFLKEVLMSIPSEQKNEERWPLLETLEKWKTKHTVEKILLNISIHMFPYNLSVQ